MSKLQSNESFISTMNGTPNVLITGVHTSGSSGDPRIVKLPLDTTVSVPRWIDYLPGGTRIDESGFQKQVAFKAERGAFDGQRANLLTAALERLRHSHETGQ